MPKVTDEVLAVLGGLQRKGPKTPVCVANLRRLLKGISTHPDPGRNQGNLPESLVRHYRAIDAAGGIAVLDLYEGMPHIFQIRPEMAHAPETKTALKKMKVFLNGHLGDCEPLGPLSPNCRVRPKV